MGGGGGSCVCAFSFFLFSFFASLYLVKWFHLSCVKSPMMGLEINTSQRGDVFCFSQVEEMKCVKSGDSFNFNSSRFGCPHQNMTVKIREKLRLLRVDLMTSVCSVRKHLVHGHNLFCQQLWKI